MLLVIHNLPANTRYADIKALIKEQCGLTDLIVDNLVSEGQNKKVTVGLADDADGNLVMSKLNGLYIGSDRLYVEHSKQKKSNQSFGQPGTSNNDYTAAQYSQYQDQYNQMFYGQANSQFLPLMGIDPSHVTPMASPNFGVPFYMTAQNPNVGTNQQYTQQQIQYPQPQGPMNSDPYGGQDYGANRNYKGNRDRSRSPNRGPERERGPRGSSRWNESDRNDRFKDEQSYKDEPYQDRGRSFHKHGSESSNRYEKNYHQRDQAWKPRNDDGFSRQNESFNANDRRKIDRRFQNEEPQRFREDRYPRDSETFSRKKKHPFDDEFKYAPQDKKFRGNTYNMRGKLDNPGGRFAQKRAPNPQPDKSNYFNKMAQQPMKPAKKKLKKAGGVAPPNPPPNMAKMSVRYVGWLCQAAALISNEIIKNVGCEDLHKRHPIVRKLKACVRSRIDVIAGDGMTMKMNDMITNYRKKFPLTDDPLFYEAVVEKVDKAEIEEFKEQLNARNAGIEKEGQEQKTVNDTEPAKAAEKPKPAPPKQKPPVKLPKIAPPAAGKLPKYPGADKAIQKTLKRAQNEELEKDNLYPLDEVHEKALQKELDTLWSIWEEETQKVEDDVDVSVSNFLNEAVLPHFKKHVSLMVRKRVLDIRTSLSIRVYFYPGRPKSLDEFLRTHGVVSMKRSQMKRKLYVATCDSYESYDYLCNLGSVKIESSTVQFKPLIKLVGNNTNKKNQKQNKNQPNLEEDCNEDGDDAAGDEGGDDDAVDEGGDDDVGVEGGDDDAVDEGGDDDAGDEGGEGHAVSDEDVIELPDNAAEAKTDSNAPNSDVIVVEDLHNHSAETIVIEDDTAENRDKSNNASNQEHAEANDDVMIVEDRATDKVINVEGSVEEKEPSDAAKDTGEGTEQAGDSCNGAGEEWDGTGEAWDDVTEEKKGEDQQAGTGNPATVDFSADDLEDF